MGRINEIKNRFEPLKRMLLTQDEVCAILGVSANTFNKRFVESGELQVVKLDDNQKGNKFYIQDVEELIKSKRRIVTC